MTWEIVYSYVGWSPRSMIGVIAWSIVQIVFALFISYLALKAAQRQTKTENYRNVLIFTGALGFLIFSCFSMYERIGWGTEKRQLSADAASGRCTNYDGIISKIYPETGDGHMAFSVGVKTLTYDNHHLALHEQLCSQLGPKVCIGDFTRVCVDDIGEGEIVRIAKAVKQSGTRR